MKDKNGNEVISLKNWLDTFYQGEKNFLSEKFDHRNPPIETIEDFWNEFIEKRLLDPEIVLLFNEELYKYIDKPGAVFAIRAYHGKDSGGKEKQNDETKFRRGFYTETNDDYSFFYTDNSFAYYFFRMAYDGLYPSADELYNCMTNHEFYYKYRIVGDYKEGKEIEYATIFPIGKKDPEVTKNYKLAHIYDQGKNYNFHGSVKNREYFCDEYFPRGELDDWKQNSNNQYIRLLNIPDDKKQEAKAWIKAQFLRFVSPMNYFLAPKGQNKGIFNLYWPTETTISMDIGENPNLLSFVQQRMYKIYKNDYDKFRNKIFIDQDNINEDGTKKINIIYSSSTLTKEFSSKKQNSQKKQNKAPKKTLSSSASSTKKVGELIQTEVFSKLENGKVTDQEIIDLQDRAYSRQTFGISYPLLVKATGNYDKKRYYKKQIMISNQQTGVIEDFRVCSQWIDKHLTKIEDWISKH